MDMIESLSEPETAESDELSEIPAPVTAQEEPIGVEKYDDEDVELIWPAHLSELRSILLKTRSLRQ